MDQRHVYLLYDLLCLGQFASALEIGSYNGASSTAFVESLKRTQGHITLCDINPTESLLKVSGQAPQSRLTLTPQPSTQVLGWPEEFDCVFVDGFHRMEDVGPELELLLKRKPRCVMAHDTSATRSGLKECEGAQHLKSVLFDHCGYQCIEDAEVRDGERTHRGFLFATTDAELFQGAQGLFEKWGRYAS